MVTYFCNSAGKLPQEEPGTTSYFFLKRGQMTPESLPSNFFKKLAFLSEEDIEEDCDDDDDDVPD